MGVSKNNGTPKSSSWIGFSIINHPYWGIPIFGNTYIPFVPTWIRPNAAESSAHSLPFSASEPILSRRVGGTRGEKAPKVVVKMSNGP